MKKTIKEQLEAAAKKYAKDNAAGDALVSDSYIEGAKWWSRNSAKPIAQYEKELKKAHEEVVGPTNYGIMEQIRNCAILMEHRDRLREELAMQDSYMRWEQGSTKQMSQVFDQRAAELRKVVGDITDELTALGLNYNATPSKIREDKKRGVDAEKDGLANMLSDARQGMTEVPEL